MDDEMLKKIKEEYDSKVPEKLAQIQEAIEGFKKEKTEESLVAFRLIVHKIAGNAGLYGYDTVTELCKAAEKVAIDELDHFEAGKASEDLIMKMDKFFEEVKEGFSHVG